MPWFLPEVRGDADLLYLALRNVLGNAAKFTQPDEAIQVRAFEDTNHIVVEVADEGSGIPEEELPYVTEELYRGKEARGLPGSGLGLALVRAIVERHGGQVSIRSRVKQGTVVSLRLPRM
jgi:two-component system, OmpR family, sensor kinase